MFEGDKSRKTVLVDHGFRLPSALDNRPLRFEEFMEMTKQRVYVSATPGPFEILNSRPREQEVHPREIPARRRRPTGQRPSGHTPVAASRRRQSLRCRQASGNPTGRRADHPPDRPTRPRHHPAPAQGPDRRHHRALPPDEWNARNAFWSPPSPSAPRRTSANTSRESASRSATSTPTSMPSNGSKSCDNCATPASMSWSASTSCGRAWIYPRFRSSAFSTPTRRASSATRPH